VKSGAEFVGSLGFSVILVVGQRGSKTVPGCSALTPPGSRGRLTPGDVKPLFNFIIWRQEPYPMFEERFHYRFDRFALRTPLDFHATDRTRRYLCLLGQLLLCEPSPHAGRCN
jgi:hypothetical protein